TMLVARGGHERPIDDSAAPILDVNGRVGGVVLVFRDVTERRRADAERLHLLAAERTARADAERANQAKDEFLASLSHELGTPLNSILGWARMLRTGLADEAQRRRALDAIERNSQLQAQLIEDLLDVSRIAAGKLDLEVAPLDLGATIGSALEL